MPGRHTPPQRLLGQRRVVVRGARLTWLARPGVAPVAVGPLDFSLESSGRQHRVEVTVGAAPEAWDAIHLAGEFRRAARADAATSARSSGNRSCR